MSEKQRIVDATEKALEENKQNKLKPKQVRYLAGLIVDVCELDKK